MHSRRHSEGEIIHNCPFCVPCLCQQMHVFVNVEGSLRKTDRGPQPHKSLRRKLLSHSALLLRPSDISGGWGSPSSLLQYPRARFDCCVGPWMVPASFKFQLRGFRAPHFCASHAWALGCPSVGAASAGYPTVQISALPLLAWSRTQPPAASPLSSLLGLSVFGASGSHLMQGRIEPSHDSHTLTSLVGTKIYHADRSCCPHLLVIRCFLREKAPPPRSWTEYANRSHQISIHEGWGNVWLY